MAMLIFGVTVSSHMSGEVVRLGREGAAVISFPYLPFCFVSQSLYCLSTLIAASRSPLEPKEVTYLISFGRQCLPIPSRASGRSTFHLVFMAARRSSKLMLILLQSI